MPLLGSRWPRTDVPALIGPGVRSIDFASLSGLDIPVIGTVPTQCGIFCLSF
jgi:hypothetical protein